MNEEYTDAEILAAIGQSSDVGQNYSDAEILAAIGEQPKPKTSFGEKISSGAVGAADLATFGFFDELVAGGMAAVDPNKTYKDYIPQVRQAQEMVRERAPISYGVGQVAGAILPMGAVPKAVTKGVTQFASKGLPQGLATGLGVGALSGGVYGLGSGQGNLQERTPEMALGAAYGAAGGVAGSAIGSLAGRAMKLFKNKPTQQTGDVLERLTQRQEAIPQTTDPSIAVSKVAKQLKKDFGSDIDEALNLYKSGDMTLAELYGAQTTALAKGAAVYPSGRAVAEKALEESVGGSYDRVLSNIRQNISGIDNYYTTAEGLLSAGRAKAAPFYNKSKDVLVNDSKVLGMPEVQKALNKVYAETPTELKDVAPNSIQALDQVKKLLDGEISAAKRAGDGYLVGVKTKLKNQLLQAMDDVSPDYKKAREIAGDYLTIDEALESGRNALKVDSEEMINTFKNLTEPEKNAYKIGLGKAIRDEVGKVGDNSNPYKRILGSPEKRKRIGAILSPEEFINFEKGLKAEDELFKFRNTVLGGSPTADKLEAQKLISGGAVTSLADVPQQTFTKGLKMLATKLTDGLNDKTAGKVSEILYERDPVKKLEIVRQLRGDKLLTKKEVDLIERTYALVSPYYDATIGDAKLLGRLSGGTIAPALSGELKITVNPSEETQ